jgi:hypothetical protein
MLAVDLQRVIGTLDGPQIVPKMQELVKELTGNPMPENWPSTIHVLYLLSIIIQHIPAQLTTTATLPKLGDANLPEKHEP